MKTKLKHGAIVLIIAVAVVAVVVGMTTGGSRVERALPSSGVFTVASSSVSTAFSAPIQLLDLPGIRSTGIDRHELPLRYFVKSEDGAHAVAALLYTGYPVKVELLGLSPLGPQK